MVYAPLLDNTDETEFAEEEGQQKASDDNSESPEGAVACRICCSSRDSPVNVCGCKGSAALVHMGCLQTWLSQKGQILGTERCEICKVVYRIRVVPPSLRLLWRGSDTAAVASRKRMCKVSAMFFYCGIAALNYLIIEYFDNFFYGDYTHNERFILVLFRNIFYFTLIFSCTYVPLQYMLISSEWRRQSPYLRIEPVYSEQTRWAPEHESTVVSM